MIERDRRGPLEEAPRAHLVRARRRHPRDRGGLRVPHRASSAGLDDDAWKWGLQTLGVGFPSCTRAQRRAPGTGGGCLGRSPAAPSSRWCPARQSAERARRSTAIGSSPPVDREVVPRRRRRRRPRRRDPHPRVHRRPQPPVDRRAAPACGTTSTASPTARSCSTRSGPRPRREPDTAWVRCQGIDVTTVGLPVTRARPRRRRGRPTGHRGRLHAAPVRRELRRPRRARASDAPPPIRPAARSARGADGEATGLLARARVERTRTPLSMRDYADPDRWAEHIAARGARAARRRHHVRARRRVPAGGRGRVPRDGPRRRAPDLGARDAPPERAPASTITAARLDGPPTGDGDEWCRVGAMKLFADGGVAIARRRVDRRATRCGSACASATSRSTRAPPSSAGSASPSTRWATSASTPCSTPATRSRTRIRARDHRFRIEHAGVTSPDQWRAPRRPRRRRRGAARLRRARRHERRRVRALRPPPLARVRGARRRRRHPRRIERRPVRAGAAAVVRDPWRASAARAAGRDFEPDQSVPFDDWLAAYTAARRTPAARRASAGSSRPGLRADLVVLDRDGPTPRTSARPGSRASASLAT